MILECSGFDTDVWLADARAFVGEAEKKVYKAIGNIAHEFEAIKNDSSTTVDFLKTMCYAVTIFRLLDGQDVETSENLHNWTAVINFLEGVEFVSVLSSLFPLDAESIEEVPLYKTIINIGLMISDCAGGCLWLLEIGVPLFGPFSESLGVISFFVYLSSGSAFVAFVVEGGAAVKELGDLWEKDDPKKISVLLLLVKRTAGAVSIILAVAGVASAPVVIGFGIVAASVGVIRFVYDRHCLSQVESVIVIQLN